MFGLFYPYGMILQAVAILHFARRRPDTYWLWIILIGGGIGALAYIVAEVIPDAGLLRGTFQVFPRRQRINELRAAILDNPAVGNYEELGALYLDDGQYVRARECFDEVSHAAAADQQDAHAHGQHKGHQGTTLFMIEVQSPSIRRPPGDVDVRRTARAIASSPVGDPHRAART